MVKEPLLSHQKGIIKALDSAGALGDWPASNLWTGDHGLHNLSTACGSASVQVQ